MASNWTPESWQSREARHLPVYPDAAALGKVLGTLTTFPPLVFAGEARALKADLAQVRNARGLASLLLGRCQRRQEHASQDRDDGDHHQQFDQGEGKPTSGSCNVHKDTRSRVAIGVTNKVSLRLV